MRLVLRSDVDDKKVEIDVLPEDTFETLSNRLAEQESFSVNLKQLSSETKPFEMTTNVMEYFESFKITRKKESGFKQEAKEDESSENAVPALSSSGIMSQFTELSTNVKTIAGDSLPSLEPPPLEQLPVIPKSEDIEVDESQIVPRKRLSVKYCRLCAGTIEEGAIYIFQATPTELGKNDDDEGIDTLADKINETLPILVSKEDELPKQICLSCVESLNASHAFTRRVTAADDLLKKLLYQSNEFEKNTDEDDEHCPLCCDGSMKVLPKDEIPDVKDDFEQESNEESEQQQYENGKAEGDTAMDYDEYYEEYNEEGNIYMRNKRRGRPKGSRTSKRQYPWDDADDEDWSLKEESSTHKKRGRPKGSKNKTNQQEQPVQCSLCSTWHSDTPSVLAHTLEVHCVDETSTFPCPLCKAVQPDEGELIYHVSNHGSEANTAAPAPPPPPATVTTSKVKMWGCPLCGQVYESQDELGSHILADHVQAASPQYQCPLCDHLPTSGPRLAHHITDNHTAPPHWNCPLCEQGHDGKPSVLDHVVRSHVSVAAQTTQCPLCEKQYMTDEEMADHLLKRHSLPTLVDRPQAQSQLTCTACGTKFKSHFNLIKHNCPLKSAKKFKKNNFPRA
ncbi:hypothetical protein LSTR_LSTR011856 [Laodelphax striatellus]|uniref:ZAD domain-containing protein n=1 Tax=Laodelphax striatellus TaxID=195883 RepID=A0A482XMC9_LAOST|nr:hypothetical protein LSTR_LSTR011856 [Laodelphax striatellus]